ncbi:uncharacterized protein L3040_008075 [Drepanopeziza brunnea f. sp. 'multigermtubi']|uniref:uncharacterized protein n=1 Tax=Drepanopeziza brunnea f. sp. 'multigermtubi' TaxID=698441 RepID=UPI00238D90FB|nr:hypothetical protein L3040_008075 [Drepanopeziza brunnea f. sp. 'multigermtubi']
MKFLTLAASLAALAPGVLATRTQMSNEFVPRLSPSIENTPAYDRFVDPTVKTMVLDGLEKRQEEPSPDRNTTLQDGLIFVLQCINPGFRDPCISLGAPPGVCASYFSFNGPNSTALSDLYNNNVSSISTNTGGNCQFYKYLNCNEKGDDRGLTVDYNYDLSWVFPGGDPRAPEYDDQITSWRC